jgi:hypothetical protein
MAKGDKSSKKTSRFAGAEKVSPSKRGQIKRTQSRFATSEKVSTAASTRSIARQRARKLAGQ